MEDLEKNLNENEQIGNNNSCDKFFYAIVTILFILIATSVTFFVLNAIGVFKQGATGLILSLVSMIVSIQCLVISFVLNVRRADKNEKHSGKKTAWSIMTGISTVFVILAVALSLV